LLKEEEENENKPPFK